MKKNLLRALAAILVIALVGGGAAWWVTTNQTKQEVVDAIARINAKTGEDGSRIEIKYAGIETAGLPPTITVRLIDPSLTATIPGDPVVSADGATATPGEASVVRWAFKGHADIITNHLGASYGLALAGNDTIDLQSGAETASLAGTDSDFRFSVTAKSVTDFLEWEKLDMDNEEQMEHFMKSIRAASMDMGKLSYADPASGQPALTQELGKIELINRSEGDVYDFDFAALIKDSQAHPAYGAFQKKVDALSGNAEMLAAFGIQETPFAAERAGKQNMDVAMSVYVAAGETEGNPRKVKVNISRASASNDFYDMQMPFVMEANESTSGLDFTLSTDTKITFKPAAAKDMEKVLEMAFAMAPMMAQGNPAFNIEAFKAKVMSALPTMSTLGPVTFAVDMKGNFAPEEAETSRKGTFTLTRFDFSHARWGLNAKGTVDSMNAESPTVTMDIACVKCDTLTSDAMSSAVDAQAAMQMLDPAHPAFPLGEQMLQAINQMLAKIGKKDAATGDITFAVTTPAANDIRINDQPVANVMMEAMTALMPFIMPQAAAEEPAPSVEPEAPQVDSESEY